MANIKQAKKRIRQNEKRRTHNVALRSAMRTYIKTVVKAISAGNKEQASSAFKEATSALDKMANKKLISKNKAARHKTRLNARIKAIA